MKMNIKKKWYVLQTFSGFENKVVKSIQEHIKLNKMKNLFGKIMVPKEAVIEIRSGQRKRSQQKFFPGYILIQMNMSNKSWHLIKNVPRVVGFIGSNSEQPSPISNKEVEMIQQRLKKSNSKPRPKIVFEPGETIRVKDGPFADFNGVVEEVDYEKNRLKVSVSIFGRSTPVELDFSQVEKNF
ncbi:MAG TPA: transcription termination/antitermination protein NusG [Buchnera sp. (in: enterobacteria)]|nr:transcription termination/antitermination protein NusG [Buchnera sp. (in: enterobacteria)]